MGSRRGRLLGIATIAALAGSLLASPAAANHQCPESLSPSSLLAPKTGTLVASCMDASQVVNPPGSDSPGTGTATIWIDLNEDLLAFEVHTADLELPIHGALIYEGGAGETGPERYTLFGPTYDLSLTGCDLGIDPELRDLLQKSKPFHLEIYDDLWRDGAIRGQLVYTYKSGMPPYDICYL
jgi:hypothetical protein